MPNPKPEANMESHAGNRVTIISVLIIAAIVFALVFEIFLVESKFTKPNLAGVLNQFCSTSCDPAQFQLAMEQDAQLLRTDRVRTSMISRLMVFVIAEIVALMLVALGGVLVFNRIESKRDISKIKYGALLFESSFPGLIMCGIGAGVIAWSLYLAAGPGMIIEVFDRPVFTRDLNYLRNRLGDGSGQRPAQTTQEPAVETPLFQIPD